MNSRRMASYEPIGGGAPRRRRRRRAALALGGASLALCGWAASAGPRGAPALAAAATTERAFVVFGDRVVLPAVGAAAGGTRLAATNGYVARDGRVIGGDYSWATGAVLDVRREATFSLVDAATSTPAFGAWTFDHRREDEAAWGGAWAGSAQTFDAPGDYVVRATSADGATTISGRVHARYVRREVRDLLDDDRQRFFAALRTTYRVPTAEGRRRFGDDKYKDATFFVREHLESAGGKCDHFHDGLGFLNSHAAIGAEFEQALQAVDARVSLPYWDYTRDSAAVTLNGSLDAWYDAALFSPDAFGSARPADSRQHVLDDGSFWASLPVPRDRDRNESAVVNAYGYLRPMWNPLKTPFLTRCSSTLGFRTDRYPTCGDVRGGLRRDTWDDFGNVIMYEPHGTVHNMVGGTWAGSVERGDLAAFVSNGTLDTYDLFQFVNPKGPWQHGVLVCPSFCSDDTDQEKCSCHCPKKDEGSSDYEVLEASGLLDRWADHFARRSRNRNFVARAPGAGPYVGGARRVRVAVADEDAFLAAAVATMCTPGFSGGVMDSAANVDPLFWSIHAAVERLWQWKRLSPAPYVYRWLPGSAASNPHCRELENGHDANNTRQWKNLFDADDVYYTNHELYEKLAPTNGALPYVFDGFDWPHCVDDEATDVRRFWQA